MQEWKKFQGAKNFSLRFQVKGIPKKNTNDKPKTIFQHLLFIFIALLQFSSKNTIR